MRHLLHILLFQFDALLLPLFVLLSCTPGALDPAATSVDHALRSSFALLAHTVTEGGALEEWPSCGATATSTSAVLTAAHCVEALAPGAKVDAVSWDLWWTTGSGRLQLILEDRDDGRDLALLRSTEPLLHYVPMRAPNEIPEPVIVVRRFVPLPALSVRPGELAGLQVAHGDSGSGVFGADGALLGVVRGYLVDKPTTGIYVPAVSP